MNLQNFAEQHLPPGMTSSRLDCPVCGGDNTFSIQLDGGTLRWKCFRDACRTWGHTGANLTTGQICDIISNRSGGDIPPKIYQIPPYFCSVANRPDLKEILKRNNSYDAWYYKDVEVLYDPRGSRLVFVIKWEGKVYGVIGKGLGNPSRQHKWHKYSQCPYPLVVSTHGSNKLQERGIIVEDCFSACAVSTFGTGIALLSTTLTNFHVEFLMDNFKECLILLDPKAEKTALDMHTRLSEHMPTRMQFLADDPKCFSPDELKEWIS